MGWTAIYYRESEGPLCDNAATYGSVEGWRG